MLVLRLRIYSSDLEKADLDRVAGEELVVVNNVGRHFQIVAVTSDAELSWEGGSHLLYFDAETSDAANDLIDCSLQLPFARWN